MTKCAYPPTPNEERLNVYTHLPGIILGIVGIIALSFKRDTSIELLLSYIVYGITFIAVFAVSSIYHSQPQNSLSKDRFKKIDHACIYLFIAGTYTPLIFKNMIGPYRNYFLAMVWCVALFGVLYKIVNRFQNSFLSLSLYFFFGFMCFFAKAPLLDQIPETSYYFLVLGALCYSVGVIFYVWNRIPFNHSIWHIFVLMGACAHYIAVYNA